MAPLHQRRLQPPDHVVDWYFSADHSNGDMGFHRQCQATTRANVLWQLSKPLRDEASGLLKNENVPLLSAIVRYNLKHRKADIVGRLVGGAFTSYASTGGRFGNKRLSKNVKRVRTITNLGIASYGAAIKAVVEGHETLEAMIQSVLTGRPERLPGGYRDDNSAPISEEESKLLENLGPILSEVMSLTQAEPGPIPIAEFCSRPENINLKAVCI